MIIIIIYKVVREVHAEVVVVRGYDDDECGGLFIKEPVLLNVLDSILNTLLIQWNINGISI